jgi:hypothetical protein
MFSFTEDGGAQGHCGDGDRGGCLGDADGATCPYPIADGAFPYALQHADRSTDLDLRALISDAADADPLAHPYRQPDRRPYQRADTGPRHTHTHAIQHAHQAKPHPQPILSARCRRMGAGDHAPDVRLA